jgi:hypothetical protein
MGVAIRRANQDYIFEPDSVDPHFMTAVRSIGLPVAFSMSSNITSMVFSRIPPYKTSITIEARGINIPVVDSLASIPLRGYEIKQSPGCLVRKDGVVLLWANTVESAISNGSDVEQMLMETVRCRRSLR